MTVADRIAVMDHGRIAQTGTPEEIYQRPNSRWVAGFVGDVNLIEAQVTAVYPSFVMLEREGLRLRVAANAVVAPGMPVAVALRPEKISIAREAQAPERPRRRTAPPASSARSGISARRRSTRCGSTAGSR